MTADTMVRPACPGCGRTLSKAVLKVGEYTLWRCGSCRLLPIFPRPEEPPHDLYDENYFVGRGDGFGYTGYGEDGYAPGVYAQIRERLRAEVPAGRDLLDVGCASGGLVEAAVADGWKAVGVDPGEYAVRQGRAKGLDLRARTLREARFGEASFDVIVSLHTVEHLPDPAADLREMRRIIRPNGLLVVEVPNARSIGFLLRREKWAQLKPPEHINFFDGRALAALLRRTGWRPAERRTVGLPHVTVMAADRAGRLGGAAARIARVTGAMRAIDRLGFGGYLRMFARPA